MKVIHASFFGDVNIGLYGKVSDEICIVGNVLIPASLKKISETLDVEVQQTTIAKTDLTGIFSALNKNGIVLPGIISQNEFDFFQNLKKEFDLNILVLETKFTAVGNLILCNDKGLIASKLFSGKEKLLIEDYLGVEGVYSTIVDIDVVGSCGVATNNGCLLHRDANEEELKTVEEVLKVNVDIGTANFGSPFVGSCILANSKGALIGEKTTGPEIVRLQETLNLI